MLREGLMSFMLCCANYVVWFSARHLHQRTSEHHYLTIGKHLEAQHDNNRTKIDHLLKVLRKSNSKFDCLVYEILYIKDIKPSLNTQADSIFIFYSFFSLLLFSPCFLTERKERHSCLYSYSFNYFNRKPD